MAKKTDPNKVTLLSKNKITPPSSGTGASLTRTKSGIQRIEGANYNGQTTSNIRSSAKIASAGNKSKPYVFKPSDTPSASGTRAYNKSTNSSLKKAQRKVKK